MHGRQSYRVGIHRRKVARGEERAFSADLGRAILHAADSIYRAPLATLAMTRIRAGGLPGLQWQKVDFTEKRIAIARSV